MAVNVQIPILGDKYQDYRMGIPGDSYNWGPVVNAKDIQYFALHHSVTAQTAKNDGNWRAEADKIANLHLNRTYVGADGKTYTWQGVGYRFIICSDGTVAYVGDLSHGGSAVGGNNHIIFSACLIGDFTKELPTAAQVHSAHILCDWFINKMPQYPGISGWDKIIGHQDANKLLHLSGAEATACPGSNWRVAGDSLRERVINDHFDGYPNPQPTWALPEPTPTPPAPPVPPEPVPQPPAPEPTPLPPTPEPIPTPPAQEEPGVNYKELATKLKKYLYDIKTIVYGKGFWWTKVARVKKVFTENSL